MRFLRELMIPKEGRPLSNILKQGIFFFVVLTLADLLFELVFRIYEETGTSSAGLLNECCTASKLIIRLITGFFIAAVLELLPRKR